MVVCSHSKFKKVKSNCVNKRKSGGHQKEAKSRKALSGVFKGGLKL